MMTRVLLAMAVGLVAGNVFAQSEEESKEAKPRGLTLREAGAFEGYNLYSPLDGVGTYLIDNEGRVVHFWDTKHRGSGYLLNDGTLLRLKGYGNDGNGDFHGGGAGYGVQLLSWEGGVLWDFDYASDKHLMHHDVEPLPNGNVLIIAWERKSVEEAVQAGFDPEVLGEDGVWPLQVLEVSPEPPNGGDIVWEWHIWDHLIQDLDNTKSNFAEVAAHRELIEASKPGLWLERITDEEREELIALGYLGDDPPDDGEEKKSPRKQSADWLHTNAIAYNPELDQIVLSVLRNDELWIIDHSTTTEQARGHSGGRYGKGGDILYRWGNPLAYRAGSEQDQTLFGQHNVQWIPQGSPGAGNLLVFNNGRDREDGNYSSIVEIVTPSDSNGGYVWTEGAAFGPAAPVWEYTAPTKKDFYSSFISGTQRLPNGNTLICQGADGTFFEVTPDKKIVWRYLNPAQGPEGSSHRGENAKPSFGVYRMNRYPTDHPAFEGKEITAGLLLEEYMKANPPRLPEELEKDDEDSKQKES